MSKNKQDYMSCSLASHQRKITLIRTFIGFILVVSIGLNIDLYLKYLNSMELLYVCETKALIYKDISDLNEREQYLKELAKTSENALFNKRAKGIVDNLKEKGAKDIKRHNKSSSADSADSADMIQKFNQSLDNEITSLIKKK